MKINPSSVWQTFGLLCIKCLPRVSVKWVHILPGGASEKQGVFLLPDGADWVWCVPAGLDGSCTIPKASLGGFRWALHLLCKLSYSAPAFALVIVKSHSHRWRQKIEQYIPMFNSCFLSLSIDIVTANHSYFQLSHWNVAQIFELVLDFFFWLWISWNIEAC